MSARDMILDVMNDIDPAFIKEHMDRATVTGFRKFVRYAVPAAIYAAACIAVLLILPHIIGKTPETPPKKPADAPIITETYAPSDTVFESEPETISEYETVTEQITESDEITEELPTFETEEIIDEPEETSHITEQTEPVVIPPASTSKAPEPKPEPVPEPENMVHVTDGVVPYSYIKYSSHASTSVAASDPVFTNAKDFKKFASALRSEIKESYIDPSDQILPELDYFNEEFFKTHKLYVNYMAESSGSTSVGIKNISVNSSGSLEVVKNKFKPNMLTCDMQYIVYLVAVEKNFVKNNSVNYTYNTYSQIYDPYTGKNNYVLSDSLSENILTYDVFDIPDIGNPPAVIKTNKELTSFCDNVSAACGGDTGKYFDEIPLSSVTKDSFNEYGYIYIGIYDSNFINNNNKIKLNLNSSGTLDVLVPVEKVGGDKDTDNLKMYVLRFPKRIIEMIKEVNIMEILSVEPVGRTVICPCCGMVSEKEDVWVTTFHPEYKQSGKIYIFLKNGPTREIFKISPDTTDEVVKRYLSNIEYEDLRADNYTNSDFVEDVISGKFDYKLTVSFTLKDKSPENVKKVLESFGCYSCSEFHFVSTSS